MIPVAKTHGLERLAQLEKLAAMAQAEADRTGETWHVIDRDEPKPVSGHLDESPYAVPASMAEPWQREEGRHWRKIEPGGGAKP